LSLARWPPPPTLEDAAQSVIALAGLGMHGSDIRAYYDNYIKTKRTPVGFRLESAEIESILISHPGVAACAVVARDHPAGGKRLVAYVVPRQPAGPDDAHSIGEWRDFLRARLPAPLVPTAWMPMPSLPITTSGKIDQRALPDVPRQRPPLTTPLVLPCGNAERLVAAAWSEILDLDLVGADDNFLDLGGTSLLAIRVARQLGERLSAEVDLTAFYEHPTVARMAAHLTSDLPSPSASTGTSPR
jgi:hypothetical protein